ncbi:hypothetical protein [Burkholderia diffusa]|uniref:hypothetical protein n=1 Tax=Burkholderia diffusa TaxID=488732 RepID=UPI000759C743|nr:hypothetical protein [Burkholderia diffusa]KWF39197.1 hypothetical protein WL85_09335 [Burkholderia diffusa]
MSRKTEFITSARLQEGSLWKVVNEVVGGSHLQEVVSDGNALPRIKVSHETFFAAKRLRRKGETVRDVVERLIFAATGRV